jgi:hypothetical protein
MVSNNTNIIEIIYSKNNVPIRLTYKQWAHIVETHDYMSGCMDSVIETLAEPDYIVRGWTDELIALKHYDETVISEKTVVVVYKEMEHDGFVITAFMTSRLEQILRRGVLWQR